MAVLLQYNSATAAAACGTIYVVVVVVVIVVVVIVVDLYSASRRASNELMVYAFATAMYDSYN